MAREFYTLIVVPHAKARFRKLQVSVRLAKWAGGIGGALAVVVSGILVHYASIAVEVYRLRPLEAETAELRAKKEAHEKDAAALRDQVLTLQRMVDKLGVMAGVDQTLPDPAVGGVGGVTGRDSVAPPVDLKDLAEEVASLTERSTRLEEFYRDQKILLASTPSIWPVRGYLSAGFGNRIDPFTNQWDFHPGIDISTPRGTPVLAPADGTVVSAGARGGYGNAITLNHGYGIITLYGHLDRFAVRAGQRVRRGDVIGYVGSTGRSTAPHLHYSVWVRDQVQNPIHFILDEYRSFG